MTDGNLRNPGSHQPIGHLCVNPKKVSLPPAKHGRVGHIVWQVEYVWPGFQLPFHLPGHNLHLSTQWPWETPRPKRPPCLHSPTYTRPAEQVQRGFGKGEPPGILIHRCGVEPATAPGLQWFPESCSNLSVAGEGIYQEGKTSEAYLRSGRNEEGAGLRPNVVPRTREPPKSTFLSLLSEPTLSPSSLRF